MNRSKKAAILSIGQASTFVLTLVLAMILARVLSQEEYAAYLKALMVYKTAAPILILGLPSALYYFLPEKDADPSEVLSSNLACGIILALAYYGVMVLGGAELIAGFLNSPELAGNLRYLAPYPLAMVPMMALGPCLMTQGQAVQSAGMSILTRGVIFVTVMAWVFLLGANANNAIIGQTVGAYLTVAVALYLMFRSLGGKPSLPSWRSMKEQVCYSAPLAVGAIVATLFLQTDKTIVARLVDDEEFAIFATGAFELPIFAMMTGAITAVIMVDLRTTILEGKLDETLRLWKSANLKTMQIVLPIGVVLYCCRYDVMELAFGPSYRDSGMVFGVYLLLVPVRCISFQAVILASGGSKVLLYGSLVGLVLNLVLTWFLVEWAGAVGAAISTVVVVIFWTVPYCCYNIANACGTSLKDVLGQPKVIGMAIVAAVTCGCWWPVGAWLSETEWPILVRIFFAGSISGGLALILFSVAGVASFKQYIELARSVMVRSPR